MRLRKASVTDRPTQTQIPFRVVDTFFRNATEVRMDALLTASISPVWPVNDWAKRCRSDSLDVAAVLRSAHSRQGHGIIQASARGNRNTIKLEIPEMRNFAQPVARFERTPHGIVYEVYDVGSPQGNQIVASLEEGRRDRTTQLTISNAESATWWRFI
jgi:hypothetical protein